MAGTGKTNQKRRSVSTRIARARQIKQQLAAKLSITEQRTFCGCRGIVGDYGFTNNVCPKGFPWLCGGVPASESEGEDADR